MLLVFQALLLCWCWLPVPCRPGTHKQGRPKPDQADAPSQGAEAHTGLDPVGTPQTGLVSPLSKHHQVQQLKQIRCVGITH